jgi:hypothetical protein
VLRNELHHLRHETALLPVSGICTSLGEHPFHQRVTIGLGDLRQLLTAQSPPDRLQVLPVVLERDFPDSAPTSKPLVDCLIDREVSQPHVPPFGHFRCDPAVFAPGFGLDAVGEALSVAGSVRLGADIDLKRVGGGSVLGGALVDWLCAACAFVTGCVRRPCVFRCR